MRTRYQPRTEDTKIRLTAESRRENDRFFLALNVALKKKASLPAIIDLEKLDPAELARCIADWGGIFQGAPRSGRVSTC